MKITESMTLAELALLRGMYGVTMLTQRLVPTDMGVVCEVTIVTDEFTVAGRSSPRGAGKRIPEIEALDDAFARLMHLVGAAIAIEGAASGASAHWAL